MFEISGIKLNIRNTKMILCCIYRLPSENPNYFLQLLEKTVELLYQPTMSFIICGDLYINFLVEGSVKQKLETVMKTVNLTHVVTFPRMSNNKGTLIDSVFIDEAEYNNTSVYPFENGLSDHVAQVLIVEKIKNPTPKLYLHGEN
jgi:hypothetical protein